MTSEIPEEILWQAETTSPIETTTVATSASTTGLLMTTTTIPPRPVGVTFRPHQAGFVESILITVGVVLSIILLFAAIYFYLVRKLGYFSDNPAYKRRMHYSSVQYQTVSSQRNASNSLNAERRPRPSTLCLTKTTTSDGNLRAAARPSKTNDKELVKKRAAAAVTVERQATRAEPESSTVGSSAQTSQADPIPRNPPPAQLPRKRIEILERTTNGDLLITASSSAPSTTTVSDNSFVTARSVYFTPTQGDWTSDVPLYRSSRDWRYAYYSGLVPGYHQPITSAPSSAMAR